MEIKVVKTQVDKLLPNDWNPNVMRPSMFEKLKRNIVEFGYLNKIVVDNKFVILNGYHRWLALKELGYTNIEVIQIMDNIPLVDKKLLTINLNELRGESDESALFDLISDIIDSSRTDLEELIAIDTEWMDKLQSLDGELIPEEIPLVEPSILKVHFQSMEKFKDVSAFLGTDENLWEKKIHMAVNQCLNMLNNTQKSKKQTSKTGAKSG